MRIEDLPRDPAVAVWVALIRAGTAVQTAVQADVKTAGFPPLEWYDVLWDLERASPGGRRPFELEKSLLLAQYNLSRLIDRLVRAGYVARQPCEADGRGQVLVITEDGRSLRRDMWRVCSAAIETHIAARLGQVDARTLSALLVRLMKEGSANTGCGGEAPANACGGRD